MTAKERGFSVPKRLKDSIKTALEEDAGSLLPHEMSIAQEIVDNPTVYGEHLEWLQSYFSSIDVQYLLHGGDDAREWIGKVNSPQSVVASAFSGRDEWVYFIAGPDEKAPLADSLFSIDPKTDEAYTWEGHWKSLGIIYDVDIDRPTIMEVDFTTARGVAEWIMDHPRAEKNVDVRGLDPVEFNIFRKAEFGLDYKLIDRLTEFVEDIDVVRERSQNAQKQVRDGSGRFSGGGAGGSSGGSGGSGGGSGNSNPLPPATVDGKKLESEDEKKKRLIKEYNKFNEELDTARDSDDSVLDRIESDKVRATIEDADNSPQSADEFLEDFKKEGAKDVDNRDDKNRPRTTFAEEAAYEPDPHAVKPSDISKLPDTSKAFCAIVDKDDHNAVLNLAVVAKSGGKVHAYIRMNSAWYYAPELLAKFQSTDPPYLVRLQDEAQIASVIEQIDAGDEESSGSLEDVKTQAEDAQAVAAALLAFSQTGEQGFARDAVILASLTGNHRMLSREVILASGFDLLDARSVDDYGTVLIAGGVPGVADTPKDFAAVRRLRHYWLHGAGAAKIRWGTPGDWTRCNRHLRKYMGTRAKGYCQNLHHSAVGFYTGDRKNK